MGGPAAGILFRRNGRQRRGRAGIFPVALVCGAAVALVITMSPLTLVGAPQAASEDKPSFDFTSRQAAEPLTFEVASVRPSHLPPGEWVNFTPLLGAPGTRDPGQITWSRVALKEVVMAAYGVQMFQIINAPDWFFTELYDIAAKVPTGATKEQVSIMWQNLLKERFGLLLHHESKEFRVDELTVAKTVQS